MKRISTIIILALAIALTAGAQQRRGKAPVRKSAATTAAKKTNTLSNIAIVNMGDCSLEKPLAESSDFLYFIEQLDRSVLSVDKKTGDIKQFIPGGREKMITAIGHDGKDLYMMVTNVGLVRYNGTDRGTSPCLYPTSDYGKGIIGHQHAFNGITFSPNKRWLVAYGTGALLFDMDGGQCKFVREYTSNGIQNAFVFDDGAFIAVTTSEIVAVPTTANTHIKPYHEAEGGAKYYKIKSDIQSTIVRDGMLYGCWNRFIAKTPLPWQEAKWQLVYQLESEDNRFQNFAMGEKRMFAECEEYGQYYCEWASTDFANAPKVTDKLTTTIFDQILKRPHAIQRNSDRLYFDQQGNLIMYGYDHLDIYNPDGIKGYAKLQNKRTRYKGE